MAFRTDFILNQHNLPKTLEFENIALLDDGTCHLSYKYNNGVIFPFGEHNPSIHADYCSYIIHQINARAKIYSVDYNQISSLYNFLSWCINNKIFIVSASMSFNESESNRQALQLFAERGGIFVCAGGNSSSSDLDFPALDVHTIAVNAINDPDSIPKNKKAFATFSIVEVKDLQGRLKMFNGTSASTPILACIIAYLSSNYKLDNLNKVLNYLMKYSKPYMGEYGSEEYNELFYIHDNQQEPPLNKHWAEKHFKSLNDKGLTINEKRFDDNITRAEVFALLDRLTDLKKGANNDL